MEWESLLGGFVADRARLCDIIFPEGETTTLGFAVCTPFLAFDADPAGEAGFASVGVGGVTSVVGASTKFGGVAGSSVTMSLGVMTGREEEGRTSFAAGSGGGDACKGESSTVMLVSRFLLPKNVPKPLLVLGRGLSAVSTTDFWVKERFVVGVKASFSLRPGEVPRLETATSKVWAWRGVACSSAVTVSRGAESAA